MYERLVHPTRYVFHHVYNIIGRHRHLRKHMQETIRFFVTDGTTKLHLCGLVARDSILRHG